MKNLWVKIGIIAAVLCFCVTCMVVFADPGTESDPLVSKSYVEQVVVPKLQQYVDGKIAALGGNTGGDEEVPASESFEVVNVKAGYSVICSAGTELILRAGDATIIATTKGGLADTTAGCDQPDGEIMPSNHLLIVPVADGRGFQANTDVIVMIKGMYVIE